MQYKFPKLRGRWSKAIWNFSENSSVLVPWPVPHWNSSSKGRGSNHPSCEFISQVNEFCDLGYGHHHIGHCVRYFINTETWNQRQSNVKVSRSMSALEWWLNLPWAHLMTSSLVGCSYLSKHHLQHMISFGFLDRQRKYVRISLNFSVPCILCSAVVTFPRNLNCNLGAIQAL